MSAQPTVTADVPAPAPPRRRRWPLLVLLIGLLAAGGTAAYLFVFGSPGDPAAAAVAPAEGEVVEVGTLTTNLADAGRYARVGIALVLRADADPAAVQSRFPLVKDAAISVISQHDAASLTGGAGTEELRTSLAERVSAVYPDGEVLRVVLTELLVQ